MIETTTLRLRRRLLQGLTMTAAPPHQTKRHYLYTHWGDVESSRTNRQIVRWFHCSPLECARRDDRSAAYVQLGIEASRRGGWRRS